MPHHDITQSRLARRFGRLVLATSLAAVAMPALGEWMLLSRSPAGDRHYVDIDSLKVSGPRRIRVVTRVELAKPTYGMETRSMRVVIEQDCLLRRQRPAQVMYFTGPSLTGDAEVGMGRGNWADVAPETIGDELLRATCQFR